MVRISCVVAVKPVKGQDDAVLVTVDLRESAGRRQYQPPRLPSRREETYSTDELDLLSPGAGSQIAFGEDLIEAGIAIVGGLAISSWFGFAYAAYVRFILGRGMKTDVFDPLPDIDVLDPSGGVTDVPVQQIVTGAGVVPDDDQVYPVTGWLEAFWQASPIE
jgi:hypothetical protein